MVGWLLNVVYGLLLLVASPLLVWRAVTQGKYRSGWSEKLWGRLPRSADGERVVWLHAVSVGEVLQLRTVVDGLRQRRPDLTILVTATTVTGHAVASDTYPDCRIAYCPLDFTWAVRNALRRVRPVLVGLVELELWPNLIRETAAAGVPLLLINGRISERSYRGYRRLRPLMQALLQRFDRLATQSEDYAARLSDLGAPDDRLHVTGSIKFDGVDVNRFAEQTAALRSAFGIGADQRVFMAGSTHDPEESMVLAAWRKLRIDFPDLRLILVPRHRERFDDVAALIETHGLDVVRRSNAKPAEPTRTDAVCLLDTLGELSACWGLADVAFVGGSLTSRGGQNMIEPAAYGLPVVVGPNTSNFRDVVNGLRSVDGIRIISDGSQLAPTVHNLLSDEDGAQKQGQAAQAFVHEQQGASGRTLRLAEQLLPPSPSAGAARAA